MRKPLLPSLEAGLVAAALVAIEAAAAEIFVTDARLSWRLVPLPLPLLLLLLLLKLVALLFLLLVLDNDARLPTAPVTLW